MAQFPGLSLTLQGNKMILKSSTGKVDDRLIITKAVIGDGQLTTNIDNLTSLVSPKLEIGLSNVKEVTNGQMQLQFNFDNKKVDFIGEKVVFMERMVTAGKKNSLDILTLVD